VELHQEKIYTKASSARALENFMQVDKTRQNHLGGRVALTEGFTVTGALVWVVLGFM
jgi:hypothetical protein